uniref:Similar to phosphoribosylformylglycinamidine synthase n=1 Tax=Arundo donax TaxID=35708 RepID=A0A0A9ECQ2_ARUDO
MSHGSKPAAWNAADISLSLLLPSSRMTATFGFVAAVNSILSVNLGVNDNFHEGDVRLFKPSFSSLTQDFSRCSSSSWKLVSSHKSLRSEVFSFRCTSPSTTSSISGASVTWPITLA